MLRQHDIDAEELRKWLCVKDGKTYDNTGTPGMRFQIAWASETNGGNYEDAEEEKDADTENNDQED